MQTQALETAFYQQWQLLSEAQKELLLNIALNFKSNTEGQANQTAVPTAHWERILKEQEAHRNGSKSYTREEVKEMARNKEKRHGLPSRD